MAKTYLVTREGTETIKNKTLNTCTFDADVNTLSNIEADNLKTQATDGSDAGKILVVKADTTGTGAGKWEITTPTQYKSVSALPTTGDVKTVYFLNTAGANPVGLYVWTGSAYAPAAAGADVDGVTIVKNASTGKLEVPTGTSSVGISVTNFKTGEVLTALSAAASQSDSKLLSEKATGTELANRPQYDSASTDKEFTVGIDAGGIYFVDSA